ncbi:hypothetical protein EJN92_05300 [Undibacterium parvum]|uniref:Uncharacterized protein n=1 Tax=Undibacterium parvum TaxID=401471 RepID=A0A3Q9BPB9_9BURK|nr:hypothetical protein EJN92_05300 [Undibacterium parvum]
MCVLAIRAILARLASLAVSLEWNHAFSQNWALLANLEIKQLLANLGGSPLSKNKTNLTLTAGINYNF